MDKKLYRNVDEFIAIFPKDVQDKLHIMRETIIKAAPGAEETVSYGIPTFKLMGKNLVHFSAYKKHIGFYPGASGIEKFQKQLSKYEFSKGTVRFPIDSPLPLNLITRIVKFRVSQNLKKK